MTTSFEFHLTDRDKTASTKCWSKTSHDGRAFFFQTNSITHQKVYNT